MYLGNFSSCDVEGKVRHSSNFQLFYNFFYSTGRLYQQSNMTHTVGRLCETTAVVTATKSSREAVLAVECWAGALDLIPFVL